MAHKPHRHTELSDVKCSVIGCKRHIKKNVIERKKNIANLKCYQHYSEERAKKRNGVGG